MKKQTTKKVSGETLVNFILDKSGSMDSVKTATISGFNEYLNTLKKDGNTYSFSLTLFDYLATTPSLNEPIEKIKELNAETYWPSGGTALYDAVCGTISKIKEKKNQKVITIIMTDGEENSSKEFTEIEMKKMIKEKEKKGNWTFVYLGANQDSYATAHKYGFSQMNTTNFVGSAQGISRAMNTVASNTANFSAQSMSNTVNFFSEVDQTNLGATSDKDAVKDHFSALGKKSWEKRKKDLLN